MIGILNIYKEKNMTSSNVVVKVKKLAHEKRVGHLGTLDPLAVGVLPICVGKATRLFDYFLKKTKTYIATFKFGEETATLDLEGEVVKTSNKIPTLQELNEIIKENFIGQINQIPPSYSSKKINGRKSCDLARKGNEVELEPCKVEIFSFDILKQISDSEFEFRIDCSSGTYIRALARDLGAKANSCATMTSLKRIRCGNFYEKDSVKLEELTEENIEGYLIPLEEVLKDFESISISKEIYEKLRNGIQIPFNGTNKPNYPFTIYCQGKLKGIGKFENSCLKMATYFV